MTSEFLALSVLILLFSVIIHEVAHGFAALKFGDYTAKHAGRLTLNPIPHIDLFGTILLPALLFISQSPVLFGWAKPVPVNPLNFSNIKRGELVVSLAGVGANFLLALVGAVLFHTLSTLAPDQTLLLRVLYYLIHINLILVVFNLLPIPPLDGSKVLLSQLPLHLAREYQKIEPYAFFLLLALWFVRIGNESALGWILGYGVGFLKLLLGVF